MAFRNLTPLPCLPFLAQSVQGGPQQVVLVKLTLELLPAEAEHRAAGFTHVLQLAQEQHPLRFVDRHRDAFPFDLEAESDLAPGKPRCDLIVLGAAHAPGGRPASRFPIALRLQTQDQPRPEPDRGPTSGIDLRPGPDRPSWNGIAWAEANRRPGEVLVDKRLRVTGERWLRRRGRLARILGWVLQVATLGLLRRCPWRLTPPGPIGGLPLSLAFAYGGQVQVERTSPQFGRLPKPCRLAGGGAVWEANPMGRGFAPGWYLRSARLGRLAAPQIEDPRNPFTAEAAWRAMTGRVCGSLPAALAPQGMGAMPRTGTARLSLAGTWDQAWVGSGAPYPRDFDPAFWNAAHPDLQCRRLEGDEVFELTNLCPAGTVGARRDGQGNTVLRFALPGLFPYVLITREDGGLVPVPALLDTVLLCPDEGRVTCLQRACWPAGPPSQDLTLRLIMPDAPREIPLSAPERRERREAAHGV